MKTLSEKIHKNGEWSVLSVSFVKEAVRRLKEDFENEIRYKMLCMKIDEIFGKELI